MMCGVCGVDEEVDEVDGGSSREVRKLVNPQRPSQKEVDAHELTHLPFPQLVPPLHDGSR